LKSSGLIGLDLDDAQIDPKTPACDEIHFVVPESGPNGYHKLAVTGLANCT
jgi:hypothetical protein